MATRDTIIDVVDQKLGYRARIEVPYDVFQLALRDSDKDYLPNGRPVPRVKGARDHICIQAMEAMSKKGRSRRYLAWSDIEDSVRASDHVPARGTPEDAPVVQAYQVRHAEAATDEPEYPPTLLNHQGCLFSASDMLIPS